MKKKQIIGFDILKFVMALIIVSIHIPIKNEYLSIFQGVGVPVFFVLSSYFIFKKARNNSFRLNILETFLKRIGILYLFWFVVNIYFILIDKHYLDLGLIGGVYLVRDLLFSYTYPGSWFLSALLLAVILIYLVKKINTPDFIIYSIAILIYVVLYNYKFFPEDFQRPFHIMEKVFRPELSRTFLIGIPWVTLGYFVSNNLLFNRLKLLSFNKVWYAVFLLIAFFISYNWKSTIYILRVFMVLTMLIWAYNITLDSNKIYLKLRNASILFFFLHFPILKIISLLHINIFPNSVCKYLFVLTLCGIFSSLILTLAEHKRFFWLKYAF